MMGVIRLPQNKDYCSERLEVDFYKNILGINRHRFSDLARCLKFSHLEADEKNVRGKGGL